MSQTKKYKRPTNAIKLITDKNDLKTKYKNNKKKKWKTVQFRNKFFNKNEILSL
jgi:hypothetical protein